MRGTCRTPGRTRHLSDKPRPFQILECRAEAATAADAECPADLLDGAGSGNKRPHDVAISHRTAGKNIVKSIKGVSPSKGSKGSSKGSVRAYVQN